MNFSLVVIGKNEAHTLPKLAASLQDFFSKGGEAILVDTGSTDGTADVARNLGFNVTEVGDRFIETIDEDLAKKINDQFIVEGEEVCVKPGDKLFNYSAARNFAASLAANDMIAMPDCDEVYTTLNIDRINQLIEAGIDQFEYSFVFCNDEFGNPLISFNHSKFYNRRKLEWRGVIHEILASLSGNTSPTFVGKDTIFLQHFQNEKTDRSGYLKGLALDCYMNPGNDRNSHYFGRELMYKQRYNSAIKEFERHIAMGKWAAERAQSWIYKGDCYLQQKKFDDAIHAYLEATIVDPTRREAFLRLAAFYYRQHLPFQVTLYAHTALQVPRVEFYTNNDMDYTFLPHEYLYWAYWEMGDKERSKLHYDLAASYNPKREKIIHDRQFYYQEESLQPVA